MSEPLASNVNFPSIDCAGERCPNFSDEPCTTAYETYDPRGHGVDAYPSVCGRGAATVTGVRVELASLDTIKRRRHTNASAVFVLGALLEEYTGISPITIEGPES
jgi:hypothetical protein